MNQYLSDKIKVLSVLSIILVLYIHSGFHADELKGIDLSLNTQLFISGMLGRCAVPLFFMISGYLFFLHAPDVNSIFVKMKKRINTLLVPYIISSIFFVLFFIFLDLVPNVDKFTNSSLKTIFLDDEKWYLVIQRMFWGVNGSSPIAFQLWFLRDLIIIVTLSPILFYLFKYLKWTWLPVVFALTFFFNIAISIFWFCLGGYLAHFNSNLLRINLNKGGISVFVIFLILSVLQLTYSEWIFWTYLKLPIILFGIVSIWLLYDVVFAKDFLLKNFEWLEKVCSFTFFIYLFHEPSLNVVRKLIVFFLGKEELGYLTSYLISPWVFISIAVLIGTVLKKHFSKPYEIAVGGR